MAHDRNNKAQVIPFQYSSSDSPSYHLHGITSKVIKLQLNQLKTIKKKYLKNHISFGDTEVR